VAASAVPPTRLAARTRAAVRAVLLAELSSAGSRARAAGCPPETLFEVLDARLCAAAEEVTAGRPAAARSAAEDREHRRDDPLEPGFVGEGRG